MRHKRSLTALFPAAREKLFSAKGIDAFHGAEPARHPIPGQEYLATNEEFLALESLPRRIVLVGAGYTGLEFATIAATAGACVTVLEMGSEVLRGFEPDLAHPVVERLRALITTYPSASADLEYLLP